MVTTAEAPSLYPDLREVEAPKAKGPHGYYRRGDNGWLITAGCWPSFRDDMEFKGFEYLAHYGTFINGTFGGSAKEQDARGTPWNPADEPWRLLFQHGGAKEFPLSQIIAYHWHLRAPYREIVFPQLQRVEITDYRCPECKREVLFSAENEREAVEMLRQHLMSRINGRHSYTLRDLTELGQMWGIDFGVNRVSVRSPRPDGNAGDSSSLATAGQPAAPALTLGGVTELDWEYQCAYCSWAPVRKPNAKQQHRAGAKRFHERRCKANPVNATQPVEPEPAESDEA